ncbi:hypothetical protein ACA910_000931 [Epithemia clementina (nom. ined.)]
MKEQALIECDTTKGPLQMRFYRAWSPHGYDRAVELYEKGFFDDSHFFRAVPNFLVQFGITYSSDQSLRDLMHHTIEDDPQLDPRIKFDVGYMSFAGSGPNSRTSQMFIAYGRNENLGTNPWETPFGIVESGMENAKQFYSYGDMPPWGKGPVQGKIYDGPQYINDNFPLIDKFKSCSVKRFRPGQAGYAVDQYHDREPKTDAEENKSHLEQNAHEALDEEEEEEEEEEGDDEDDEEQEQIGEEGGVERDMAESDRSPHRELHRLGGLKSGNVELLPGNGIPLSPQLGLAALGGIAVLVYIVKSFVSPSRKLNQKDN